MVAFDVETALAEFLRDAEKTSLQLPHMTTGQRKATKKLLEEFPELRCESFGFGADRQLHIFKKGAKQEDDCAGDSVVSCGRNAELAPAKVFSPVHEKISVRNTFIHFDESADKREIRSMPHGMFRKCLLAEQEEQDSSTQPQEPEAEAEPATAMAEERCRHQSSSLYCMGTLVVIEGLVRAPQFNGLTAIVQGWDDQSQRYDVLLAVSSGCQNAKIKEENLRSVICTD